MSQRPSRETCPWRAQCVVDNTRGGFTIMEVKAVAERMLIPKDVERLLWGLSQWTLGRKLAGTQRKPAGERLPDWWE